MAVAGVRGEALPLVGRRRELDTIKQLLEKHRLVTLTGVGGAGKTRLARRVAAELGRIYKDSAWIVELADLQDPQLLGHTVARAVGIQVRSADFDPTLITQFLGERAALLVVDNCEHVAVECAELVETVLASCPSVRVLATSQRALGLVSESLFQVPPLSFPSSSSVAVEALAQYESINLFVERAAAVQPGFEITEANAAAVVEVVRALEGIPLAIELAAARTRVLSPDAMVDRLGDRYGLLSRGFRGRVPDRQQSLEASVTWTHDLCSPPERQVWAELSVFRGGFDYRAAERVAGTPGTGDSFLDVLDSLVERSVVRRDDLSPSGAPRFRMLETLRLYGERSLRDSGREDEVRRRHRDHFLEQALAFETEWTGAKQTLLLGETQADYANVQAALQYSIDQSDADVALRHLSALEEFWITGGLVSEARRWIDLALAEMPDLGSPGLAPGLRVAAWFALIQVDTEAAAAVVDGMRVLVAQTGDDPALQSRAQAETWLAQGLLAAWTGEVREGVDLIGRAVEGLLAVNDVSTAAFGLVAGGLVAGFTGDLSRGRAELERALLLTEPRSELYMRSYALAVMAALNLAAGDLPGAEATLREALAMKRTLGDQLGIAIVLEFLAWTAVASAEAVRASTLLGAADAIWQVLGVSMYSLPHFSQRRRMCEDVALSMQTPEAHRAATDAGSAMGVDTAISYALREPARTASPRRRGVATPSPLTPREREVAELVRQGLSNQAIAETLVVAVRTAEAHVENILRKLGFTSRSSIAAWVSEHQDLGAS